MKREELIKKWLDNRLSAEEQTAFEALPDYKELTRLSAHLKTLSVPEYNSEVEFETLKPKLNKTPSSNNWVRPLLKAVAVIVIGLVGFYSFQNKDSKFTTDYASKTQIELPDASLVDLNADSQLSFNENSWSEERAVNLNGEAFFKVAKGSKFEVITDAGTVQVLGTGFNVIQRHNFFEVTCFEGRVAVMHLKDTILLNPTHRFAVIDGKISAHEKENSRLPKWLSDESSFTSRPLKFVLNELERQYNITVNADAIDSSQLFSGNFTHKNLDLALKSIALPLNISYTVDGKNVVLK
ncbi:FecR family protein [Winogradskyella maritima]|uniref:FecR family protein n=1 Tax=Winogradskyella maritima TaxID=1517766 RepID=A0ABV8AKK7_9FLAO|nr:FecR family protein [Winogradskyella maritima]